MDQPHIFRDFHILKCKFKLWYHPRCAHIVGLLGTRQKKNPNEQNSKFSSQRKPFWEGNRDSAHKGERQLQPKMFTILGEKSPSSRFLTKYLQINPGGTWQKLEEKVIISVRLRMGYPKVFLQVIYLFLMETHSDRNWEMQKYLLCRVGEICHFFVVEISALWKHANEFRKGRNWLDVGHATQWT